MSRTSFLEHLGLCGNELALMLGILSNVRLPYDVLNIIDNCDIDLTAEEIEMLLKLEE